MFNTKDFAPWLVLVAPLLMALVWYWSCAQSSVKSYTYKNTAQGKLELKVHYPHNWAKNDQRPLIAFFFGGGWVNGSIEQFKWQAEYFAQRGMVAVRVDYRVDSRHGTSPVQAVEDGQDAIAWIGENAAKLGIDPEKIVVSGGSAGGHIAACTAICNKTEGIRPAALVLLNPVLDLTNATPALEFTSRELELIDEIGSVTSTQLSPNLNISPMTPPTLLIVGSADPLIVQAAAFHSSASRQGISVKMKVAERQNHGFFNKEPWRSAVVHLIDRYLTKSQLLLPRTPSVMAELQDEEAVTGAPAFSSPK